MFATEMKDQEIFPGNRLPVDIAFREIAHNRRQGTDTPAMDITAYGFKPLPDRASCQEYPNVKIHIKIGEIIEK